MAEMKDSGIEWCGKIPISWNVMPNKYVMHKKKEICPKYNGEDILSLTMDGVIVRDLDAGGKMPASFDGYQRVHPHNLLMCLFDYDVTPRCIGLIQNEGLTSPAYSQFVMKNGNDARYYYYYYLMIDNTKELLHLAKNLRHSFTEDQLGIINTPVPPVEIQKQIAKYLDQKCEDIDAVYVEIEKQIETLEEYKKSIITEAVTKGLDPDVEMKDSGISYIGNIPKHWKVTNLKYLGKCQNGISKGGEYFGNGFPFVSYGDVYKNYSIPQNVDGLIMSTKTEQNIYSVKYGDVFFTRTSETIEEIGFASTCLKSIDNSVFAGFLIRFRPTSSDLIPEFSKFYFRSNIHRKFFVKEMNLVTRASLSQNLLGRLPVLLPPLCEQQMIAINLEKKCAEIDGAIEEKKEQLEILEQYKKSLIYEYVTGKKEVK